MALTKKDKDKLAFEVRVMLACGYSKEYGVALVCKRWGFKKATVSKYWDALKPKFSDLIEVKK